MCCCSVAKSSQLFAIPWSAIGEASLSFTISLNLFKLMSIQSVMTSKHLILWHPLLLLPSIFSNIRVFSSESVLQIRGPIIGLQLQHQYFQRIFRVIFFRINWVFYIIVVPGTFKSLQHHSSKAILCAQPSLMVQLSHSYMTTGKIIALTI